MRRNQLTSELSNVPLIMLMIIGEPSLSSVLRTFRDILNFIMHGEPKLLVEIFLMSHYCETKMFAQWHLVNYSKHQGSWPLAGL